MGSFYDYIRPRLEANGYKATQTNKDLFMRTPDGQTQAWICYLDAPIEPEQIHRCFDIVGFHILFVVNEKLIPDEITDRDSTPMWLRVLHGLYMGRIYVWNERYLFGLHFDYDTGDVSESGIIQPDELLLVETGTWLRGWTGTYKLARFYDRTWWSDTGKQRDYQGQKTYPNGAYSGQQSNARTEYEQARDRYQQAQREREKAQRTRYDSSGWAYDPADWPNGKPPDPPRKEVKRDFMREFAQAGSPSAVKALYRELAKLFHPDLNPGVDTTEQMQEINKAYERWR